ncbi:glycosyltransferase [Bacillus clarus]|uniref:Glycosyl transferase 2 family protein n=1 Tax=Bacillus clarus TaxID=2338372 RepID=A0A090YSJ3_9BACI|nr:glycosyltransferase [Bacillus clarus]KFN01824.1 glycosyl transferase 2 family protein [Bacillus clarus]RFT64838.1 glycosyltransferase [Bacillus clarus]
MHELISVIVPIYNVEKWLARCIESVLKEPFVNIELVLVNDGSTDKCGEICEEYLEKDNRIKVIYKENGGVSSARNAGIEAATGKYIVFIDPDDEVSENYFTRLYGIAEDKKCDAVICGYKTVPNNNSIIPNFKLDTVMNGRDFVLSSPNVHSKNDLCFAWRYIYNLSIIKEKNIRFNEQVFIGEDVIFNLEFLLHSQRVCAISEGLYFYTINNSNSLMRVPYKPNLENSLVLQYQMRRQLSQEFGLLHDKQFKKDMANYYINHIYRLLVNNLKSDPNVDVNKAFRRIVNYEMFSDSVKGIGFSYRCNNFKEYIYYLAIKFKVYPLIVAAYKREIR